jgi:site-specific DNA recombinase
MAYRTAPDQVRRWLNQAFFTRILVTEEEIEVEFTPAMRTLLASVPGRRLEHKEPRPRDPLGRGSETLLLVEPRGIEPLTSCLQSRRSTN